MEIHIGDRVADVTLVSKEGNKVQFMIDGKPYDVDIVMAESRLFHPARWQFLQCELIRGRVERIYDVNMLPFLSCGHSGLLDQKYLRMKKGGEERQG